MEPFLNTTDGSLQDGPSAFIPAAKALLSEMRSIEVPSAQVYLFAVRDAMMLSGEAIAAWYSFLVLVFCPLWRMIQIVVTTAWPPTLRAGDAIWRFQASLPRSILYAEVCAAVVTTLLVMLRRFIIRHRVIARIRLNVGLLQARAHDRCLALSAAVEWKFRISARALPHLLYWTAVGCALWLAPSSLTYAREKLWTPVTITLPVLRTLFLALGIMDRGVSATYRNERAKEVATAARLLSRTRESCTPRIVRAVDRAIMYWVVFSFATCCGVLAGYLPLYASIVRTLASPTVRTVAFLGIVWIQIPGPSNGLKVVYAAVEPVVRSYMKDIRSADSAASLLGPLQQVLVFCNVLSGDQAQIIADNVADSWLLLPTPLFFLMPGFLTKLGCLYAGTVVPALNSIKTLKRRPVEGPLSAWVSGGDSAGVARMRWLSYWVVFGIWCHASCTFPALLRLVPFSRHLELALLLWFQIPIFHGAGRLMVLLLTFW